MEIILYKIMIKILRKTKETDINLVIEVYGSGISKIDTGVPFLNHMLESFTKHSNINLEIKCIGDTHIDDHHSVEDIAIVLGKALRKSLYPIKNIERFGNAVIVMDEASVNCDIDLSNRPYLVFEALLTGKVGLFDAELVEEFFRALVFNFKITAHIILNRGLNKHHIIEACFKAFAVSLRRAIIKNKRGIPSTKGIL